MLPLPAARVPVRPSRRASRQSSPRPRTSSTKRRRAPRRRRASYSSEPRRRSRRRGRRRAERRRVNTPRFRLTVRRPSRTPPTGWRQDFCDGDAASTLALLFARLLSVRRCGPVDEAAPVGGYSGPTSLGSVKRGTVGLGRSGASLDQSLRYRHAVQPEPIRQAKGADQPSSRSMA